MRFGVPCPLRRMLCVGQSIKPVNPLCTHVSVQNLGKGMHKMVCKPTFSEIYVSLPIIPPNILVIFQYCNYHSQQWTTNNPVTQHIVF